MPTAINTTNTIKDTIKIKRVREAILKLHIISLVSYYSNKLNPKYNKRSSTLNTQALQHLL
jgi:hypothetical protein